MSDSHWKKMKIRQEEQKSKHTSNQGYFASSSNQTVTNWQQASSLSQAFTNWLQPSFSNQGATNWRLVNDERTPKKKHKRNRIAFSDMEIDCLEAEFQKGMYLDRSRRRVISEYLGLEEKVIKVWFQNRRMREKRETLKSSKEEEATDLTIPQPKIQELTKLKGNMARKEKNRDDSDDEQPLQIIVDHSESEEQEASQDSSDTTTLSRDKTNIVCNLLPENISKSITHFTDSQLDDIGVNLKIENEVDLREVTRKTENTFALQPHVFSLGSDDMSVGPNESTVSKTLNVTKTATELDTSSEISSISYDSTPTQSPGKQSHKAKSEERNFLQSPYKYYKYRSSHKIESHAKLSSPSKSRNRLETSVSNSDENPDVGVCKGPYAPSPDCKCGCHDLSFLTYPQSHSPAFRLPLPTTSYYYDSSSEKRSRKNKD